MDISEVNATYEIGASERIEKSAPINFRNKDPWLLRNDVAVEIATEVFLDRQECDFAGTTEE